MKNLGLCTMIIAMSILALAQISYAADKKHWSVVSDESKVTFGSVKKDTVGEVHTFNGVTGSVSSDGKIAIEIATNSVETNIDIRNERILRHVFQAAFPAISINGQLDMSEIDGLDVGGTNTVDVEASLTINGKNVPVEMSLFVARLSKKRVLVTTDEMIMLSTEDLGIDAGITKLMELAKLPGITRVTPVTVRLVFKRSEKQAGLKSDATKVVATATTAAIEGDIKKGKKVYKKCKACHDVKKTKNKVGPHLVGIFGREIASVDGFKYSKTFKKLRGSTWTVEELTAFLKKPKKYAPGNKMSFAGLKKDKDINNLLAYIQSEQK
ncbi:MAG: c-type cytochrome [Pseudomonadota bacterium]